MYAERCGTAFLAGRSPADFATEDYEVGWDGRATLADLTPSAAPSWLSQWPAVTLVSRSRPGRRGVGSKLLRTQIRRTALSGSQPLERCVSDQLEAGESGVAAEAESDDTVDELAGRRVLEDQLAAAVGEVLLLDHRQPVLVARRAGDPRRRPAAPLQLDRLPLRLAAERKQASITALTT